VYSARPKWERRTAESDCSSWPTATAGIHGDGLSPEAFDKRVERLKELGINGNGAGDMLTVEAKRWPTPTTMDTMEAARNGIVGNHNLSLPVAADRWMTPSARDWKDSEGMSHTGTNPDGSTRSRLDQLGRQALAATGPASPSPSGPRRLNPEFTEWLMGLPHGWTDFAPVATGWSRYRRHMRSRYCSMLSAYREALRKSMNGQLVPLRPF
jgi:hypothetical protein